MVRTGVIKAVQEEETNVGASKTTSIAARAANMANLKKGRKKRNIGWEERRNELILYKEKNGNYNVPQRRKSGLGVWVHRQRQSHRKGKLSQKHTTQLEDIGFSWNKTTKEWENRFKDLDAYKQKNGNCSVPQSQVKLRSWMSNDEAKSGECIMLYIIL